jgi:3-methyladenine DNA glycosylase Tag
VNKLVENCRKVNKLVENCRNVNKLVENCRKVNKLVENCRKVNKLVENCRNVNKLVENCRNRNSIFIEFSTQSKKLKKSLKKIMGLRSEKIVTQFMNKTPSDSIVNLRCFKKKNTAPQISNIYFKMFYF